LKCREGKTSSIGGRDGSERTRDKSVTDVWPRSRRTPGIHDQSRRQCSTGGAATSSILLFAFSLVSIQSNISCLCFLSSSSLSPTNTFLRLQDDDSFLIAMDSRYPSLFHCLPCPLMLSLCSRAAGKLSVTIVSPEQSSPADPHVSGQ
jgi:hypothetical protein